MQTSTWLCVKCGEPLGDVIGGELHPSVQQDGMRTSGPNLVVKCPKCSAQKVWYTSDQVVRAVYQLVNAIADVAADAMVRQIGQAMHQSGDKQP